MSTPSDPSPQPRSIPSGRRAHGVVAVPPSKSFTHRYLNLALLSAGPTTIVCPLDAEDTRLFMAAVERCGYELREDADRLTLRPPAAPYPGAEIWCGNAGTMYRFLVATLSVLPGDWRVDGAPRLRQRPIAPLVDALRSLGAAIDYLERPGHAPLAIRGGRLRGGRVTLEAGQSSQYLSALMMALLRASEESVVEVASLTSTPYVDITLRAIADFGATVELSGPRFRVRPAALAARRVRVEGDFSAACYPAAAAALTSGRVRLEGLRADSPQGDRRFLDLLAEMGAGVRWDAGAVEVSGGGGLQAVEVDLSSMPDQVPTLAALAPFARGTTRVSNVAHLRLKESDRLAALSRELRKLGAEVDEHPDGLSIPGIWAERPPPVGTVTVDPHDDHRIAMSLALVGLRRERVLIARPQVVQKSYPGFWSDLQNLLVE